MQAISIGPACVWIRSRFASKHASKFKARTSLAVFEEMSAMLPIESEVLTLGAASLLWLVEGKA